MIAFYVLPHSSCLSHHRDMSFTFDISPLTDASRDCTVFRGKPFNDYVVSSSVVMHILISF